MIAEAASEESGEGVCGESGDPASPEPENDRIDRSKAAGGDSPSGPDRSLRIAVAWEDSQFEDCSPFLAEMLEAIGRMEGIEGGRISLAVVDAVVMTELHRRYRGTESATDVLTFDLRSDRSEGSIDAEIVICAAVAAREADRRGHDIRHELVLYAVHGLLHLCGYDDGSAFEARRMHRREDWLLRAVGLPAVYGDGRPGSEVPR